jgi:hypothetical protein
MASAYAMRGKGIGRSTPSASRKMAETIRSIDTMRSASSMNDISTSSWVNSGWRSARGSSSRKHRTSW